jgi:branched-chain amino acid transport system ATP-binding protein
MLEISDVHTYRGASYVLQGVSMSIAEGRVTTVLGRNGMGKTTLIRSVMGVTPPRSGSIVFDGVELTGMPPHEIARLGLGLVPQGRQVFPSLTVEENLRFAERPAPDGAAGWTLERLYDAFPNLAARRRNRGNELSGGEQQMLAVGRALMMNPRIVLMDEPSEGLAPVIVDRIGEMVRELRETRITILLIEQNYRLGVDSADHVYLVSKGTVAWGGTPQELEAAEDLRELYLGV